MRFILLFAVLFGSSAWGAPSGPELLDLRLTSTSLTRFARAVVSRQYPGVPGDELTVEHVVRLRRSSLDREVVTHYNYELEEFLKASRLRFAMTGDEIEFFKRKGRLPEPTGDSFIEALGLSNHARHVLEKLGVVYVDDVEDLSLLEIEDADGAGRVAMRELAKVFVVFGLGVEGRLKYSPLVAMGLDARTAISLSAAGYNDLDRLRELHVLKLNSLAGIGAAGAAKTIEFLAARGIDLPVDALEAARISGEPLNLALKIDDNIRIPKYERLQFLGDRLHGRRIKTIADLLKWRELGRIAAPWFLPRQIDQLHELFGRVDSAIAAGCNGSLGDKK